MSDRPWTPPTPADLARWAFWVPLRNALDPEDPERLQALLPLWKLQHKGSREGRALMSEELERSFGLEGEVLRHTVEAAYRVAFRVHLEELLMGKVDQDTVTRWIRFEGEDRLGAALERGKGVLWLYPHAGPVMLMIALLAYRGYDYTQYAARGLPPAEVAKDHPELLASNALREAVRRVREQNEDRVPASYITLDTPVRELVRRLDRNQIVGIAYDGRIGQGWTQAPYLGRQALLSPGPYKLACLSGATVLPVFCRSPDGERGVVEVGEPIVPGRDWRALMREVIEREERWLRQWPEEYGIWLLHCRRRNHIDDHPFFVDHAIDDRWRKWS